MSSYKALANYEVSSSSNFENGFCKSNLFIMIDGNSEKYTVLIENSMDLVIYDAEVEGPNMVTIPTDEL